MNAIIVTIVLLVKKIGDRVRTTKYQNIFSKGYPKNWSKAKYMINSVLKTNP